jgi:Phosphotransferase enzyme family
LKPSAERFSEYLSRVFGAEPGSVRLTPLGRGSHGRGYRARFMSDGVGRNVIIKTLDKNIGLGHDYPADRANVFLLASESYGKFPSHVKALDVLSLQNDGALKSIAGGYEYYLIMEEGEGTNYFQDLRDMKGMPGLTPRARGRISAMAKFLAKAHAKKKDAPELYLRKVRDIIGHGECLMGVFDTYAADNDFTNPAEMAAIEKACVDWRALLRRLTGRLSRVHGDFHPGNILFKGEKSFTLLDRSRGEYGEPADDVTALCMNFVFFSLMEYGKMAGAFDEALRLFYKEYIGASGDGAVNEVSAPFYAFRAAVVANPLFYPDVTVGVRGKLMAFAHGVLRARTFDPAEVKTYISGGLKYRERFF